MKLTRHLVHRALLLVTPALLFSACAGSTGRDVPLSAAPPPTPELVLVWVGHGEASRIDDGTWHRVPAFDYDFSVEQRRYADHWESVKSMRRRSPDYDGSAGPRAVTYFFRLDYSAGERAAGTPVTTRIDSSLGPGKGTTDVEFRESTLEIAAEVSSMAPFDTYRITQHYGYEAGELTETVELVDHDGAKEVPWVRNEEHAKLFAATQFAGAPTRAGR